MNLTPLFTSALLLVGLWSCQSETTINEEPKKAIHTHDADHDIVLNNGEKWAVDQHMLEHIRTMEAAIKACASTDEESKKQLGDILDEGVQLLTSNCTMTGQAHDELHKWLLPYIDLVNAFIEAETDEKKTEFLEQLNQSMDTFNTYFE